MATSSTRSSLARRLATRAALWAATTALTLGAVASWQYWRVSLRALDERLMADAQAVAREIVVQDGLLQVDLTTEARARLSADASYYAVHDADGRALDGDAPPLDAATPLRPGASSVHGHREARVAGPRGSLVRVGSPLTPLRSDLGRLAGSLLLASLVALLPALPLVIWLRRTLADALTQFDRTARALAPGRSARIDLARVDDELSGVARRLNDAFDRLEDGLRRERQLTADASHELRTPVTTILAETEWALGRERAAEEYRQALDTCRRQGRRLKDLIEALLTLARLESGEVLPTRSRVDLAALLDDVVRDLAPLANERGIDLRRHGEAHVDGDRLQLDILARNLVDNAIRHIDRGGAVTVTLTCQSGKGRLTVQDTGPGLAPADAARVFDRFWRGDPARTSRVGGTGLGLAICKAIVEAHGGSIECASSAGGSTFTVSLPEGAEPGRLAPDSPP